ncbi:MAG: hypothetical protein Q8P91_02150 [bacterium]|nr:hypothetical protein [bacterium]
MDTKLDRARNIIRNNPGLIWYTTGYENLSAEAITEAILNYGSWENFQELRSSLGTKTLAKIFQQLIQKKRSNLHPLAKNYFNNYFTKYAS